MSRMDRMVTVASSIAAWVMLRWVKQRPAVVVSLFTCPIKGLDFTDQPLESVELQPGLGLPDDRRYALKKKEGTFDPEQPEWKHKLEYACMASEGPALGRLRASWKLGGSELTLWVKGGGDSPVLSCSLEQLSGRSKVEEFFRCNLDDPEIQLVTASPNAQLPATVKAANEAKAQMVAHHFSNTAPVDGMQMIHIVNLATVRSLAEAAGIEIDWRRFRPNIVVDGFPAWREFSWVGHEISLGSARLRVTKRTVRCVATTVNPVTAQQDCDPVHLLQKHFPEHGPFLGVYAVVVAGGTVSTGDEVMHLQLV
eukprot:TRINITY_DN39836_c0_g1_i1.p1 TRINITY_DN39836_c0_g1~~TRINITY_DN39836_c0_g1_i1.p1  ORF type:complete len:310 (-),score=49.47 TRINITY_DN39836_c0_g1_i1:56-985(-)